MRCRRLPLRLFTLALALALAPALAHAQAAPPAAAPPPAVGPAAGQGADTATFALQYTDTELAEIARAVSKQTGVSLLFDDRLRGRASITAPRPVRREEAMALLTSALRLNGFAVVPDPTGAMKIVPLGDSVGQVPVSLSTPPAFSDAPVTTLVPLRAADAEAMLAVVQPLIGSNAVAQAFAPTHSLILSATEAQLHRALLVIRALDRAEARRLMVLRLHYRDTKDLLPMVTATFPESRRASESLRVFADERTNALLVEGPDALVKEVREFVRSIDVPSPGEGGIHVVRITHADAEDLAEVIQKAASNAPSSNAQRAVAEAAVAQGAISADALVGREFGLSVDKATNSLVIRCDSETFRVIGRLIADLDIDAPSVSVKATLLEVEDTDSLDIAIDTLLPFTKPKTVNDGRSFIRSLNSGDASLIGPQPVDSNDSFILRFFREPVTFTRTLADGQTVTETVPSYGVDVKASATAANTHLLSEPNILARSGEEQELFVGNNIPIIAATNQSAAGTSGAVSTPGAVSTANPLLISQNVERQDVGVRLRVKPTVSEDGPVRLSLRIEFSALTAPVAGNVAAVGPTLIKQSVESLIYLDDGAGAVVGVRGEPTQENIRTGTPWLMDVPALGWLFSSISTRTVRKDLVLAVQVQVIHSAEDLQLETIRRRVALERSLVGLEDLPVSPAEAPFAVWVATTEDRAAAETMAAGLDPGTHRAEVVAWRPGGPRRFDVYVLGFDHYTEAMKTSLALRARGFDPEVVALPGSP